MLVLQLLPWHHLYLRCRPSLSCRWYGRHSHWSCQALQVQVQVQVLAQVQVQVLAQQLQSRPVGLGPGLMRAWCEHCGWRLVGTSSALQGCCDGPLSKPNASQHRQLQLLQTCAPLLQLLRCVRAPV